MALAYLRKGETFAKLAAGFGVSTATPSRYVNETVDLLVRRAPGLRPAVRAARRAGHAHLVLDGTLIPIDRVAADWPVLFRQAQEARNEPAGHRHPARSLYRFKTRRMVSDLVIHGISYAAR